MAERFKDAEDRLLESMFASEPIADDGFSERIVRRIRRRLWVKRLALPVAAAIGVSIAAGPMIDLAQIIAGAANIVPQRIFGAPAEWIPQLHIVLLAGMLAVAAFVGARALED